MHFIENVNKDDFEEFVKNNPYKSHFMQSYYWGNVMKEKNFIPHYVGLEDDGKLVATALLLQKKLLVFLISIVHVDSYGIIMIILYLKFLLII